MKKEGKRKALAALVCGSMLTVAFAGGTMAYLTDTDSDVNVMTLGNVKIEQHEYERVQNDDGTYETVTSAKYNAEGYKLQDFSQAKPLYPATGAVTGWGSIAVYFDQLGEGATGGQKVLAGLNNVQDKFVFVENTGKSDAYVRTIMAFELGAFEPDEWESVIMTNINDTHWDWNWIGAVEIDGGNYYLVEVVYKGYEGRHSGGILPAGEFSYNSLAQIYMMPAATNEDVAAIDGNKNGTYEILVFSQAVQTDGFADAQTALDAAFGDITATNHPWVNTVLVGSADELVAAIAEGGRVVLTADIDLGATQINIPVGVNVVVDLNGNDLSGAYAGADHYAMFAIPDGASLTVEGDGEVTASTQFADNNRSGAIFQNAGNLTLNGGVYSLSDSTEGKTWIIATIVDNRTNSATCEAKLTINGGEYSVEGKAKNLFRNYPQQGGTATLIINDGIFNDNGGNTTYIWNQEAGSYLGELYFNGGTYDANVVYEDYNGQSDVHIAKGVAIQPCADNN